MVGLEVGALLLVALAMSLAVAHALEMPGKMRLDQETYLAVQRIYYPGFTIGGFAEILAPVSVLALVLITTSDGAGFWWLLVALAALIAMQMVYWTTTHPANKVWVKSMEMGGAGQRFFAGASTSSGSDQDAAATDWQSIRNRWEYSHVARALLAGTAMLATAVAVAI